MNNLGKTLKACRQFNRMSQDEIASKVGIKGSYISKIENGKKFPTLKVLDNFAKAFDVKLSVLLFFAENYNDKQIEQKIKKMFKGKVSDLLKFIYK